MRRKGMVRYTTPAPARHASRASSIVGYIVAVMLLASTIYLAHLAWSLLTALRWV